MNLVLDYRTPKGGGASGGRGSSSGSSSGGKSGGKSGGSSSSSFRPTSMGGSGSGSGSGTGGGHSTAISRLPAWAQFLVIFGIIWFAFFLGVLIWAVRRELKRRKEGKRFRPLHVLSKVLLISTGLWIPYALCRRRRRKHHHDDDDDDDDDNSYAQIEDGLSEKNRRRNRDSSSSSSGGSSARASYTANRNGASSFRRCSPPRSPGTLAAPAQENTGAAEGINSNGNMPRAPSPAAPAQHNRSILDV